MQCFLETSNGPGSDLYFDLLIFRYSRTESPETCGPCTTRMCFSLGFFVFITAVVTNLLRAGRNKITTRFRDERANFNTTQ